MNSIDEKISIISNESVLGLKEIPLIFINKKNNSISKLIFQEATSLVSLRKTPYTIQFTEKLFISSVILQVEGFHNFSKIEYGYNGFFSDSEVTRQSPCEDGCFTLEIHDFLDNFFFKPPSSFFKGGALKGIKIYGYTSKDFYSEYLKIKSFQVLKDEVLNDFNNLKKQIIDIKKEISSAEEKKDQVVTDISNLEKNKNSLEIEVVQENENKNQLYQDLDSLKTKISQAEANLVQIDDSVDEKRNEQRTLNSSISDQREELRKLKDDINMFPSELSGFVGQGARSITRYTMLTLIPIVVILALTLALFFNAADLTMLYKTEDNISLWTLFVTRLPFVLIALSIVHACYAIAKIFINEIIKINQQRLSLSKISIIATDVSSAASQDLKFSEDQVYQNRVKLKMELLRDHLKAYMTDDYFNKNEHTLLEEKNENSEATNDV